MRMSIIICTYNRVFLLEKCINSVLNSMIDDRDDIEIIVVDNNSTDETFYKIDKINTSNGSNMIKYFLNKTQGLSSSRNLGIIKSSGELLLFLDDDALLDKNCLKNYLYYYEKFGYRCMGGKILPWPISYSFKDLPKWFNKSLWGAFSMLDNGSNVKRVFYPYYPYGTNLVVHRNIFEKYGYFDESLGRKKNNLVSNEEIEFLLRLEDDDESIYYIPYSIVYHCVQKKRLKLSFFVKRFFFQGISDALMFSQIKGAKYTYSKLYIKFFETVLAIPQLLGRIISNRSNYINPLFKLLYNLGYFYTVFGNAYKIS